MVNIFIICTSELLIRKVGTNQAQIRNISESCNRSRRQCNRYYPITMLHSPTPNALQLVHFSLTSQCSCLFLQQVLFLLPFLHKAVMLPCISCAAFQTFCFSWKHCHGRVSSSAFGAVVVVAVRVYFRLWQWKYSVIQVMILRTSNRSTGPGTGHSRTVELFCDCILPCHQWLKLKMEKEHKQNGCINGCWCHLISDIVADGVRVGGCRGGIIL